MKPILFTLNKKSFSRSAYWKKSVGIKAVIIFFAIYFSIAFLALGFGLPTIFKEHFPESNPIDLFNEYFWGYLLMSALIRQLVQEIPVVDIIPLLTLSIKKKKISRFVVNKSFINFFNILPWYIVLPFMLRVFPEQYATINTLGWLCSILGLVLIDHLIAILVKRSAPSRQQLIMLLYVIGIAVFTISFYDLLPVAKWFAAYLSMVLSYPILGLIPLIVCIPLYFLNIKSINENLYLDSGILPTEKKQNTYDFSWTSKFGNIGTYLGLELKMVTRNKRAKTALFSVFFLLFYGFIIYRNPKIDEMDFLLVIAGLIITGGFSISYGQFTPAWHSQYFPFLMTRNVGMKDMLNTQYFLFMVTTIIALIFSSIYVIYGAKIIMVNTAIAIFNIGFTSHLVLWMGSFSSKPIDLSQSSFMNYQGTGASQWITGLVIILGPLLFFFLIKYLFSASIAYLCYAIIGILGIIFHNSIMTTILKRYSENKHRMLYDYKQ